MSYYRLPKTDLIRRGETMSSLRSQQQTLNARLLLALQNHDEEMQAELKAQLKEVEDRIICMGQVR